MTSCWRSTGSAPSGPRAARSETPPRSRPGSSASSWGAAPRRSRTSRRRWRPTPTSRARCGPSAPRWPRVGAGRSWPRCSKQRREPSAASRTSRSSSSWPSCSSIGSTSRTWGSRSSAGCASSIRRIARWSSSTGRTTPRGTSCPSCWPCWRRRRRPRRTSTGGWRWGIEMARAAEQRSQNADKAIEIWKGLLRLRPHLPEAVASLRKLYTATEKWNALLELLKDDLDAVPAGETDEKINRHLEIVAVYRDRLNLDVMVVTTYLNILALRPDHPAALAALAGRYEAQGRYGDLVQILARQAEAADDPAARVALHRRIASLWPTSSASIRTRSPASRRSSRPIRPTATPVPGSRTSTPRRAPGARSSRCCARSSPTSMMPGRRTRLGEMARIAGERLNDTREAIALYNRVLGIEPRDEAALAGVATLYERERRWPRPGGDPRAATAERGGGTPRRSWRCSSGAARCSTSGWRLPRRPSRSFAGSRRSNPKNARAARALREIYAQAGGLHRARDALRRARGVRRAVRSADVAGRSDGRHGRAHAAPRAGGGALRKRS